MIPGRVVEVVAHVLGHLRLQHRLQQPLAWLNMVERWFAELTTKKIRRAPHQRPGLREGHS